MDRLEDNTTKEIELENDSSKGFSRRETLKLLAKGAYVVPATAMLLTAERAVAQSIPGVARVVVVTNTGAVAVPLVYTNTGGGLVNDNLLAGNSRPITVQIGSTVSVGGVVSPIVQDIPGQIFAP